VQPGDVVSAVNDAKPASMRDARARLSGALSSDVVISIVRGGAAQRLVVMREAVRK
jgi:S1-C subfamily serine protease